MQQAPTRDRGVLNLPVSRELLDQLRRIAVTEERSLAGTVRLALKQYVESQ